MPWPGQTVEMASNSKRNLSQAVPREWLSAPAKQRFYKAVELGKTTVHYGWIPLILTIGIGTSLNSSLIVLGFMTTDPKPSIFRMFNPLS